MLDYKCTEPLTNSLILLIKGQIKEFKGITFPGFIRMYTGVHSDLSWVSYLFEFFDLPSDVPLVWEKTRDTWLMCPCRFL